METGSTSTITENDTLMLKPWPSEAASAPPPVSLLIDRINSQKGSFRNISEEGLKQEIQALNTSFGAQSGLSEAGDDDVEEKPRKEQLLAAKEEIAKLAAQAFTDSAHTLDFISVLLSRYTPKQAEVTISPFLKQTLPSGSLASEEVEPPEQSERQNADNELVSFGWKLQALNSSADALLESASKLEKEMEKEAQYWDQVLAVKEKGWSVCRLPREKHTLAVRYGFLESAPSFRDKGLAILRRSDDGTVDLDLGANTATPQAIRVRIVHHGECIAATQTPRPIVEDTSVEAAILRARNSLFDEELYHEMYREARTLTNRGIKCISEGISVPIANDVSLLIDLTDINETAVQQSSRELAGRFADLPQLAATALRILLSHSHRQTYIRRTNLPPPLTERKPQRPVPSILRPILAHFQHIAAVEEIDDYLTDLSTVLKKAKLNFTFQPASNSLDLKGMLESKEYTGSSQFVNALVSALCAPLNSSIQADLREVEASFTISVRTHSRGTDYKINSIAEVEASYIGGTPGETIFSSALEVQDHLAHLLLLGLVNVAERSAPKWIASSPDEGELTTEETLDGDYEMLSLALSRDCLELTWNATNEGDGEEEEAIWSKNLEDKDKIERKGFLEELERFSSLRMSVDG